MQPPWDSLRARRAGRWLESVKDCPDRGSQEHWKHYTDTGRCERQHPRVVVRPKRPSDSADHAACEHRVSGPDDPPGHKCRVSACALSCARSESIRENGRPSADRALVRPPTGRAIRSPAAENQLCPAETAPVLSAPIIYLMSSTALDLGFYPPIWQVSVLSQLRLDCLTASDALGRFVSLNLATRRERPVRNICEKSGAKAPLLGHARAATAGTCPRCSAPPPASADSFRSRLRSGAVRPVGPWPATAGSAPLSAETLLADVPHSP
jgi:hypothetical protein